MKAVVYKIGKGIQFVDDRSQPEPTDKQVAIRVCAAAINPVDYKLPAFIMNGRGVGLDVSGIVTKVGAKVTNFQVGDAVFGNTSGSLAEYAVCEPNKITHKPKSLSFAQAAAIPTAYLTGFQALHNHNFAAGSRLLVIGASGGCGTAGVQLGKQMGAAEIVGICSKRNEEIVLAAGADRIIDYNTQDPLRVCGDDYFDFVYDTATGSGAKEDYTSISRQLLKNPNPAQGIGMSITINGSIGAWLRSLLRMESSHTKLIQTKHSKQDLEAILKLLHKNQNELQFAPVIDRTIPFEKSYIVSGFQHLKSRRARGKIVYEMTQPPD